MGLALANMRTAKAIDSGWRSMLLPISYMLCGLMMPKGQPFVVAELLTAGLICLTMGVVAWMGRTYTVGEAAYLRIVDDGPFAIVRHPVSGLRILSRVALLACWPSATNAILLGAAMCLTAFVILEEERFLRSVAKEYPDYARRVKYRLVPGVW